MRSTSRLWRSACRTPIAAMPSAATVMAVPVVPGPAKRSKPLADSTPGTVARPVTWSGRPTSGCAAAARSPGGAGVSGAAANAPAPVRSQRTRRAVTTVTSSAGVAAKASPAAARSIVPASALVSPAASTAAVRARPVRVRASNHPVRRRSALARCGRGSRSARSPATSQTPAIGNSTMRCPSMAPALPSSTPAESGPAPGSSRSPIP
ncbi:hypothetical protein [Micromonospora sp. KC207]|uniref:hypothetical protein n=1 Tax=Micromonospora sp. KC207 TaxID=2530377 RepID=UPI001FB7D4CF|nr:hypothetical protein [Micromonospora sp. KC207]